MMAEGSTTATTLLPGQGAVRSPPPCELRGLEAAKAIGPGSLVVQRREGYERGPVLPPGYKGRTDPTPGWEEGWERGRRRWGRGRRGGGCGGGRGGRGAASRLCFCLFVLPPLGLHDVFLSPVRPPAFFCLVLYFVVSPCYFFGGCGEKENRTYVGM